MEIRCPNCKTGYQVPDEKIPEEGMKVRCSKCKHVFEVKKGEVIYELEELQKPEPQPEPTAKEAEPTPQPQPTAVEPPTPQAPKQPVPPAYTADLEDIPLKFKRRRTVNAVLGIFIVIAAGAAAIFAIWQFGIKGAVPKTPSVDVNALYDEAYELFKKDTLDKYAEAADKLRRALSVKRDFAEAYALLSMCQTHESEVKRDSALFEQAQLNAQKALELGQNLVLPHLAYATIYVMRDIYEEAEKELLEAEMRDPENPLLYAIRGQLYYKQKKLDEAIKDLVKAADLDPKLASAHLQLAMIFKEKGEYDKAIDRVDKVLAVSPSHYEAIRLKRELESIKPEEVAKEEEARKPEERKPTEEKPKVDEFKVNYGKAKSLFDRGRSTAARGFAEKAVSLKPTSCRARTLLGWIYLDIGNIEAAKEQFDAAINLAGCSEALYGMGIAYKEQGNRQAAIMYIQRFLDTNPSGPLADEAAGLLRTLGGSP